MTGLWAERLAAVWLQLKGWRVLARRHAGKRGSGIGEVDLIVRRGSVLAFVEIKFRPSLTQAAFAISTNQKKRIVRGAKAFISANPQMSNLTIRFDAVLVFPRSFPRHLPNAWDEGA